MIIDDFHRLEDSVKSAVADLLKVTADREDATRKSVIVGINEAGRALIESSPDLANRIEVIRFEVEPPSLIESLVSAGEEALNIAIEAKQHIVDNARGSFYIAQLAVLGRLPRGRRHRATPVLWCARRTRPCRGVWWAPEGAVRRCR